MSIIIDLLMVQVPLFYSGVPARMEQGHCGTAAASLQGVALPWSFEPHPGNRGQRAGLNVKRNGSGTSPGETRSGSPCDSSRSGLVRHRIKLRLHGFASLQNAAVRWPIGIE